MAEGSRTNFSSAVLAKAGAALLEGRVLRDSGAAGVFWVEPSAQGMPARAPYRVQVGLDPAGEPWGTCECPWGTRAGRGRLGCYHVAAAMALHGI